MSIEDEIETLEGANWLNASRRVDPLLQSVIRRLVGYEERTSGPSERAELPGARVVVIVQTAAPIELDGRDGPVAPRAFVAGLGPGSTLTRHQGTQAGVQLDLHPEQARQVLGVPMSELAGSIVSLDDLLRPQESGFVDHIANLSSWAQRTHAVEQWVARRWSQGRRPDPRVVGALQTIERCGGNVAVGALQARANLSRPHLVRLFREHVGVPPKLFARLRRFEEVQARVREGGRSWAQLAAELGFSDQAHLSREVRALCGHTPTGLATILDAVMPG